MSVTAIHLVIHGRVQGVGYRAWTVRTARRLGLCGWVRNLRSGEVETVLSGTGEQLAAMRTQCARGPLAAKVTKIDEILWEGDIPPDFQKRETV